MISKTIHIMITIKNKKNYQFNIAFGKWMYD